MKWMITIALTTAIFSAHAEAAFKTGQQLYMDLKHADDLKLRGDPESLVAAGYVMAVHDSLSDGIICTGKVTTAQILKVVQNYLEKNPQFWGDPGSTSAAIAMSMTWPCPVKNQ
ncbi:Rap1a/Tai family immunity protein [Pseudomonas caspiana]